jgi:hypothetical protein
MPSQIPAIIRFLGYVPFKHDGSLAGKLRWLRIVGGWTQENWAAAAKMNANTIGRWEDGRGIVGSPLIMIAIKSLSRHLSAVGLSDQVASELSAALNFGRSPKAVEKA